MTHHSWGWSALHVHGNVLCVHRQWVPQIPLSELMGSCELDLDCSRIAILSLAHRAKFLAVKVLTTLIGLPCQMVQQVIPPRWLAVDAFVS